MASSPYKRMIVIPESEYELLGKYRNTCSSSSSISNEINLPSDISTDREQKLYALKLRQARESSSSSSYEEPNAMVTSDMKLELSTFPSSFRSRAQRLLTILERHRPFINWTKQGEMIFGSHGYPISGSSLTDLIHHATATQRRGFVPAGWSEFLNALHQLNIPQTVLSVHTLRELGKAEEVPRQARTRERSPISLRRQRKAPPPPSTRKWETIR